MDLWTLHPEETLALSPGPFGSFFGTFRMARSLWVPYLTGTGPYPGAYPDPWPGPWYLGPQIPFEGSTPELA